MRLPVDTWVPGVGARPDDAWLGEVEHGLLVDVGILLFDRGQGFEAHEAWELAWKEAKAAGRDDEERVLRALIKLAAAMVKVRQGMVRGVLDHADGALAVLEPVVVDAVFGVSVPGVRDIATRVRDDAATLQPTPAGRPMPGFGRVPRV